MSDGLSLWVGQAVNGLVLGNIYALLAAGLSLIMGVANLVNFAHGSVYMAGSYAGWFLMARLGWPLAAALPGAAIAGAILGLLIERIAVRPFSKAARIAPLLSTLGAGMIIDNLAELIFSPNPRAFPAIVPAWRFELGGVSMGFLDLTIILVSLASAAGLFLILKFSRFGQALRAAAQDAEAARQMGVRVERSAAAAFALASALGALAGALIGLYYNFVSPTAGVQAALKGFTACVLGGLGNVPAAMAGGLVLGIGESFGVAAFGSSSRNLISFGLLLAALFLKPAGLFGGKAMEEREVLTGSFLPMVPAIRMPRLVAAVLIVFAAVFPLLVRNPYLLQVLTGGWIQAIFAISLTLVAGTAGIMSLGQAGLMAIGAYTSGLLTLDSGWSFLPAFFASGLIAALLGSAIAFPAFKLKGHYVAIATMGLGEVVNQVILAWDSLTRGAMGLAGIPAPKLFGNNIDTVQGFYYLSFSALLATGLTASALSASPLGRTVRALREDETAARALGVAPRAYRALFFAVGAFFAGLAGSLTAHLYTYISHETFGSSLSILGLTMVILGGLGNLWGAVLGALILTILPETLRFASQGRWLAYGAMLLIVLRFRPQGLLGSK
ncbi:MAG TPA: ABC transporter permease [Rectinemataceae bacterium]|nr:ABC transporter permease [Rectinemataceae bacterium]